MSKLNSSFKDNFIPTHNITDIQILLHKAKNDYYISIEEVITDLIFLFKYINANFEFYVPSDKLDNKKKYKLYLNNLYFSVIERVASLEIGFDNNYAKDLQYILETNMLPRKSIFKKSYNLILQFRKKELLQLKKNTK